MAFEKLYAYIKKLPSKGIPAVDVCIWKDHTEVFRSCAGYADAEKTVPVSYRDFYWLYSATKVIVCAGIMTLIENGLMGLDDPICKYLPKWANVSVSDNGVLRTAASPITVRSLLSMQSGISYRWRTPEILKLKAESPQTATTREFIDALAMSPVDSDPFEHFLYGMGHDVLAAAAEVACGMTIGEYLKKTIFEPCGMNTITFHPTEAEFALMSRQYEWNEASHTAEPIGKANPLVFSDKYEGGGGGLFGRADDYIRFADMMACGGVSGSGNRILQPETIALMSTNQLSLKNIAEFRSATHNRPGYGYGLGVRTKIENCPDSRTPVGEFGWDGLAGSYVLIDPVNHISIFMATHVCHCTYIYENIHPELREMAYSALAEAGMLIGK